MANSILTPTAVTREVQRVLHEKAQFISTVNRSYDSSYAQTGAKIGDSLKIRLPNKYTVRTGKTLNAQDTSESSVTMTVATQKGVDMNFSTAELTMSLDDFSKRIIEPAVSVLVSNIEYDALTTLTKTVYNQVGTAGTVPAAALVWNQARARLNQNLAPKDNNRSVQCDSIAMSTTASAVGALFNPQQATGMMNIEGYFGRLSGLDFFENERTYTHTVGADVTTVTVNDGSIADGDSTIVTAGGTGAVGDVFTIAAVYAVHPETKQAYSHLQQFVITAIAGSAGSETWTFSPSLQSTGASQNIDALPVTSAVITSTGTAGSSYAQSLVYHKDAFAFATADLELPQGVHFAAREVMDGVSVRLVRQYDINNDNIPCRLDILYGYKEIRPEIACRVTS
jgi:hypothetical protein